MTKIEFLKLLKKHNINENLVVFDDTAKDGYSVRTNYYRWEVFCRERGRSIIVSVFRPRAMLCSICMMSFTACM